MPCPASSPVGRLAASAALGLVMLAAPAPTASASAVEFVSAADLTRPAGTEPIELDFLTAQDPVFLQTSPQRDDGAQPRDDGRLISADPREPSWYTRLGVLITFPQDITLEGSTVVDQPQPGGGTIPTEVPFDQDFTLGWGGGLYLGLGYNFNAGGTINPRLEAEYQLLLADYRGTSDSGSTWNGLGLNALIDVRVRDGLKLYGGLGAGFAYASFSTPGLGSDDDFSPYFQGLGGALIRFSDDTDIDLGFRYTVSEFDIYNGSTDFDNVTFHIGLMLYLE
jgi:opacity protein-like surface antigen